MSFGQNQAAPALLLVSSVVVAAPVRWVWPLSIRKALWVMSANGEQLGREPQVWAEGLQLGRGCWGSLEGSGRG